MIINHIIIICVFIFAPILHATNTQPFVTISIAKLKLHNNFSSPTSSSYETLLVYNRTLIIGSRNEIHGQKIGNISENAFSPAPWKTESEVQKTCPQLPHSDNGVKCYSQIQMIQPYNNTHLITCGTNSLSPQNRFLVVNDGKSELVESQAVRKELCSWDPDDRVSSYAYNAGGHSNIIFGANRRDLNFDVSLVKSFGNNEIIKTPKNSKSSNAEYVGSFRAIDSTNGHASVKIYFVSNEPSNDNAEKMMTIVTQLCANDVGGSKFNSDKWTSLLKLRMKCSTEDGLVFDVIKDAYFADDGFLYGVFTTKYSLFRVSAVCAFRISDIQAVFNSGDLVGASADMRSPGAQFPFKGEYTPGMCAYDSMNGIKNATSKDFPVDYLKYMDQHYMMSQSVAPSFPVATGTTNHDPVLVKNKETFVKIVTTTVNDLENTPRVVGFIATNTGCVYKYTAIKKNDGVETIEIAKYKVSNEAVLSMDILKEPGYLYIGTNKSVHQISTSNCAAYNHPSMSNVITDPCRMCVLARDPMCAFDTQSITCVSVSSATNKDMLKQDVTNGNAVSLCEEISPTATKNETKEVHVGDTVFYGDVVPNNIVAQWFHDNEPIQDVEDKYQVTQESQLIVQNFDTSDLGMYVCEYRINNVLVSMTTVTTVIPGKIDSLPVVTTAGSTILPLTSVAYSEAVTTTTHLEPVTTPLVTGTQQPIATASATAIVLVVFFATVIVILVTTLLYKRYCAKRQQNKHTVEDAKPRLEVTDHVPQEMQLMSQPGYNNSNNHSIESQDSESQELLNNQEPPKYQSPTNRAKSMDFLDANNEISFADDENSTNGRSVARTQSTNEISHKRKRTPTRAKSQPFASRISVHLGGRKDLSYENCTLTRNKKGKWVVELPTEFSPSSVTNHHNKPPQDDAIDGSYNFGPADGSSDDLKAPLASLDVTLENDRKTLTPASTDVLADERLRSSSKQTVSSDESDTTMQASSLTLKPSTPDVTRPTIKITPTKQGTEHAARRFDDPVEHLHGQNEQYSPAKSSHSLSSASSNDDSVYKSARSSLNSDLVV